jgi:DNA-binding transcriptional LysR family regulator
VLLSVLELQVLLLLSQGKTLTEIAGQLLMKHPTISRALHTAERKTGVTLAERTGRRLRLTSAGMDLAAAARGVLTAYQDVERLAAGIRSGEAGNVRVISTRTASGSILPEVLARFLIEYPAATLTLEVADPTELWAHFANEGCDVGVGVGPPPSVAGVRAEWLFDERSAGTGSRSGVGWTSAARKPRHNWWRRGWASVCSTRSPSEDESCKGA